MKAVVDDVGGQLHIEAYGTFYVMSWNTWKIFPVVVIPFENHHVPYVATDPYAYSKLCEALACLMYPGIQYLY